MTTIEGNNYPIIFSAEPGKEIARYLKKRKPAFGKLFILVDENSLRCCYPQLVSAVPAFEDAEIIEIESGEQSKTVEVAMQIWSALGEYGGDRHSLLVNIGGGVVTDLGGFVAATFKRGIPFINIPTTLLAQVDASVGGKTGVDLNHLKNEVGVFADPEAVFIHCGFLATLPPREMLSGFAEIVKHALIADRGAWEKIVSGGFAQEADWYPVVEASVRIKNQIVLSDPHEKGLRKTLNFGHTIGHALETLSLENHGGSALLHGEAIAAGMIIETFISRKACKLPAAEADEICGTLLRIFPAVNVQEHEKPRLLELMRHDKKNQGGEIRFSLLSRIGNCEHGKAVRPDHILEAVDQYIELLQINKK